MSKVMRGYRDGWIESTSSSIFATLMYQCEKCLSRVKTANSSAALSIET